MEDVRDRILKLRVDASKKNVVASRHFLRYRDLQKKATQCSLRILKCRDEQDQTLNRSRYFETKAEKLERNPTSENSAREAVQSRRKAAELAARAKAFDAKIQDEEKRIEELNKLAREELAKSEEVQRESKALEMEAVKLELALPKK